MSALTTVARKSFKFTAKNWFSDRAFYVTIADADIGSRNLSLYLHTSFDKVFGPHAGEIWTKSY